MTVVQDLINNMGNCVEALRISGSVHYEDYVGMMDILDNISKEVSSQSKLEGQLDAKSMLKLMENCVPYDSMPPEMGMTHTEGVAVIDAFVDLGKLAEDLNKLLITKKTSDGHHTFDELYEYRMLYNAHAAHGWLAAGIDVVKSWRHSDGEECFGGGWFIVTAELPTGQVSNHYRAEYWDLFQVPDEVLAPEYDGHIPAVAADRLKQMLLEDDTTDYDEWLMG